MKPSTEPASPFFTEDVVEPQSDYWVGRRELGAAVRELIEAATVSDIPVEEAEVLSEKLRTLSAQLREYRQLEGVIAHGEQHGGLSVAYNELLSVGGKSHPISPGLRFWKDGDIIRGSVRFNWSYEGPPGHVHGGWVAAVFDHFMGMAYLSSGKPGMTGGLDIRYLHPTPLNRTIDLIATAEDLGERKTRIVAEMRCEGRTTASSEAVFVQPRHRVLTTGGL